MKIAVVGLADFTPGKKSLIDQRLKTLQDIIRPSKTTYITLEILASDGLKDADAIICEKESKLDLIINDLEAIENRLARIGEAAAEGKLFLHVKEVLEKNTCLSEITFSEEEKKALLNSNLVSIKPTYFVDGRENKSAPEIIFEGYYALGMICFITGLKDKELRAWPVKKGTTAFEAAGVVHSDIQRGFIKAEVIGYEDLVKAGDLSQARQYIHLEGKDYIIQDADIVNFRFSV